jgi:hypothetical protein
MSYCRFGDADAYIYMTYAGFDCCGCSMATRIAREVPYTDMLGFTHEFEYEPVGPFTTPRAMLDHIEQHRAQGDHIPDDVDLQIMSEYPDSDASVVETDEEREQRLIDLAPQRERIRAAMKKAYQENSKLGEQ